MNEPIPPPELSDWQLTALAKQLYGNGPRLSWHQALTTVYRPLYAPFGLILRWIPPGATMLDLGCGTGALLHLVHALKPLAKGYGVDRQAGPLHVAQAINRDPRLTFMQRADLPIDLVPECNVIALIDIVHHVPAAEKLPLLQRLIEHAASGTIFIIKDLDRRPRWRALANRVTDYLSTRSLVDYLSMGEVEAFLRQNGLAVLFARRWNKQVWSHYLVVARLEGGAPAPPGRERLNPPTPAH
jgi:2-polyprenyl-3-methyl-5-hydroxy-6-metoxy-1,4-benzoquinol methylase